MEGPAPEPHRGGPQRACGVKPQSRAGFNPAGPSGFNPGGVRGSTPEAAGAAYMLTQPETSAPVASATK